VRDQFGTNGTINLFSDTGADEHRAWSETDGLTTFRKPSFSPNAVTYLTRRAIFTLANTKPELLANHINGQRTVCDRFEGKRLNPPERP